MGQGRMGAPALSGASHATGDGATLRREDLEARAAQEGRVVGAIFRTALVVEMVDFQELLRRDFRTGLRLRIRFRRLVAGEALRHGGEIADRSGARMVCVFGRSADAAAAAMEIRGTLASGWVGIPACMVLYDAGRSPSKALDVARALGGPADILVLDPVGSFLSARTEVPVRSLGTFMVAGVPHPVHVMALP
ncbi:MAG: hypothetical protein PVJ02_12320 [Gemmatimonadota bacterium]